VPKSLYFHQTPCYSIKKDESSYFDLETKEMRKTPGPGTYRITHVLTKKEEAAKLKERQKKVEIEKIPKRPFFMDEDLKRSRGKPGPGHYAPNKDKKVPGHVEMCLDRISFLDEAIRDKIESVGPGFYKPKVR